MERTSTRMIRVAVMSAVFSCGTLLSAADDSSERLKRLTSTAQEAKTSEQHRAIAERLVAFAEQMDEEARTQRRAAEEAPDTPKAISHKRGVTIDPKFRRKRRARRAEERAVKARRMAEYHLRKADEQQEVADTRSPEAN